MLFFKHNRKKTKNPASAAKLSLQTSLSVSQARDMQLTVINF